MPPNSYNERFYELTQNPYLGYPTTQKKFDLQNSILNNKIMSNKTTDTIADGLRAQVGTVTFPIIKENVDKILLVSEEMIISSMYMIWQRLKIVIEPSCSIVLAALMLNSNRFLNKKVGLILTGGNYDLKQIPW